MLSRCELRAQILLQLACVDALLLERVAVPHRDGAVRDRLTIDSDSKRRPNFVLPPIPATNRSAVVVKDRERRPQLVGDAMRHLRHSILLDERKDSRLDRSDRRVQPKHGPSLGLAFDGLLAISVHQNRKRRSIGAYRRLDDIRQKPLVVRLVEVLQLLAGELLVLREIEVTLIVHALDLLEAESSAEVELNVERSARVMCKLLLGVLVELEPVFVEAQAAVPVHALLLPVLEPLHVGARLDEELHLHLLELPCAKNEVAGRDLIPKRFSYLGDPERNFLPSRLLHVQEVHVNALRRLGAQIDDRRRVFDRTHERLEHQIELARLAQCSFHPARWTLGIGRSRGPLDPRIVGAEALFAVPAVDERIDESAYVPARLPDSGMHEYRGVQTLDVVSRAHHRVPPPVLEILFQLYAERTVIPDGAGAAVDLRGLEDEAAPLGERHELLHHIGVVWHRGKLEAGGGAREAGASHLLPASLVSVMALGIELRAQFRLRWRALAEQVRDDAITVITAVFDEHLVRIIAGNHDARDVQTGNRGLERLGIVRRDAGLAIDRHA